MFKIIYWHEYRFTKNARKWLSKRLLQADELVAIFWKTMENVREHRNIKLVATKEERITCKDQAIIQQSSF